MGSCTSCVPREVTLMMVGEDGAGKTPLFQVITGGDTAAKLDSPAICEAEVRLIGWQVNLLDMPGGPGARALWLENYHRCHGLVFVVDSSVDYKHLPETSALLREVFLHPQVAGKPILMLLNKQHHHMAFDIDQMIQWLSLVPLFRKSKCPCVMVECSTEPDCHKVLGAKRAVKCGLGMHLKNIARNYEVLCERVQQDTDKHTTVEEQIRGAERHMKNCDVAEGSTTMMMVGNQRSREDKRRRPEEETHEYGQLALPGTPTSDLVVSQRCPIIRRTTIDMGDDDDAPEGSVDRSVQVTLAQEGDTLLEGGGSDEPLESTPRPWHDSARLRDLADNLEALLRDHHKQVQTEAGERSRSGTVSPSDLVYSFAEESVQRLLLHFQDPPCSSTPSTPSDSTSTPSSSTSRDSSEVFRQELRLLSTAMVDQVMDNLSGSSQSTSPDLRVKKSVSFADKREDSLGQVKKSVSFAKELEDSLGQVATEKKTSKKLNFLSDLKKLVKKSEKKKKPKAGHPEDDTRTSEDFISPSNVSQLWTGPASGSQVKEKPAKRSVLARALSYIRKGLRNTFRKKNKPQAQTS